MIVCQFFGIDLPVKSLWYGYNLKREICDLNPQRAWLIPRLILEMDILMTECWKKDYNVRLELKEHCLDPSNPPDWLTLSPSLSPRSLRGVQKRPLVDDERALRRGADSEGIIKGTGTSLEGRACGFTCIDKTAVSVCWAVSSRATVIAGASHASLSALGSFRWTSSPINSFLILLKPRWSTSWEVGRNSGGSRE